MGARTNSYGRVVYDAQIAGASPARTHSSGVLPRQDIGQDGGQDGGAQEPESDSVTESSAMLSARSPGGKLLDELMLDNGDSDMHTDKLSVLPPIPLLFGTCTLTARAVYRSSTKNWAV